MIVSVDCGCGRPVSPYLVDQGDEKLIRHVCEMHAERLGMAGRVTKLTEDEAILLEVMEQ